MKQLRGRDAMVISALVHTTKMPICAEPWLLCTTRSGILSRFEVRHLLEERAGKVVEDHRPARPTRQRILMSPNGTACVRRQILFLSSAWILLSSMAVDREASSLP